MSPELSAVQIAAMIPVAVFACLAISMLGTFAACLVDHIGDKHKKKTRKRRIKAILHGDIRSYEEYLLYQLNHGKTNNYILDYQDYSTQKLNSSHRH